MSKSCISKIDVSDGPYGIQIIGNKIFIGFVSNDQYSIDEVAVTLDFPDELCAKSKKDKIVLAKTIAQAFNVVHLTGKPIYDIVKDAQKTRKVFEKLSSYALLKTNLSKDDKSLHMDVVNHL